MARMSQSERQVRVAQAELRLAANAMESAARAFAKPSYVYDDGSERTMDALLRATRFAGE